MADHAGMATAFILFTRIPVPGRCKSRLAPALSAEDRASLQLAMILDEANRLHRVTQSHDGYLSVWLSDEDSDGSGREARTRLLEGLPEEARVHRQHGAGLGARMANAIDAELASGASAALLMGSDLPLVDVATLQSCLAAFEGKDALLCPSADQGYWMAGLREPGAQLYAGKRYGSGSVFDEAMASLQATGRTVGIGPQTRDLDDPYDLAWLLEQACTNPNAIGPHVRAWLDRVGSH